MIEEDIKTLFDAEWDAARATVLSLTQTTYVFMKTDPNTTYLNPPSLAAANVIFVVMPSVGVTVRRFYSTDQILYTGSIILHGLTVANMKTAIDELDKMADANSDGTLTFNLPAIRGEIIEGQYLAEIEFEWYKLVERGS